MIRKKSTPQSRQIRQNDSNKSTDQPTPSISKKVILEILEQINKNVKWAYLLLFIIHIYQ